MKQKQTKIQVQKIIMVMLLCSIMMFCKKEVKEDGAPTQDLSSLAVNPPSGTLSEDDIGAFIADVLYCQTHPDPPKYLTPSDAIMKMEETMSYRFSDIDTPFLSMTFGDSIDFFIIPSSNGLYNMTDIASKMIFLRGFVINTVANRTPEAGCHLRVTTCEIETKGPNYYTFKFVMGNAYDNPPPGFNTFAPEVPVGSYYQWDWHHTQEGRCGGSAMYAIQTNGAEYMLSLQNHAISTRSALYYPPGKIPYYSGIEPLKVNNTSYIRYNHLPNLSVPNMPTRLPVNPGELTPYRRAMFCGNNASDVIEYWSVTNPPSFSLFICYGWCLPYDYINYYITRTKDIFDHLAPQGSTPVIYDENIQWPYCMTQSGFAVGITDDAVKPYMPNIYHVYQYKTQQIRYRTNKYYF